jgi:uncharacterized membrane protein
LAPDNTLVGKIRAHSFGMAIIGLVLVVIFFIFIVVFLFNPHPRLVLAEGEHRQLSQAD